MSIYLPDDPTLLRQSLNETYDRILNQKQDYTWLKIPLFEKELNRQRNEVFTNAVRLLKAASQKAVSTLVDCLSDESAKNRISAADKILSHTMRGIESYELEERLSSAEALIEKALKEQASPKGAL